MIGYGVQAIKRRRNRRRGRNQYVVGARMMGIPFAANTAPRGRRQARRRARRGGGKAFQIQKTTIANVRQNTSSVGDQSDLVTWNNERMVVDIPISADPDGDFEQYTFDPLSAVLPLLQQKASQYAAMTVSRLTFKYVPRTGTSVNGNFYMAFTKELADPGTYNTPNQLTSLHHIYCQASDSNAMRLDLTPEDFNESGKLLINNGDIAVEPTKYFPGQFIFGTSEVTADVASVGHIECNYLIKLSRSRLPLETQNTVCDQTAGVVTVQKAGVAWVQYRSDLNTETHYAFRSYSLTNSRLLIVSTLAAGATVLDSEGNPIAAIANVTGDVEKLVEYVIPAHSDFFISKVAASWMLRRDDKMDLIPL